MWTSENSPWARCASSQAGQGRERVARFERGPEAGCVVPEGEDDRRREPDGELGPAPRDTGMPAALPAAVALARQHRPRPEGEREEERRARQERGAGEEAEDQGSPPPEGLDQPQEREDRGDELPLVPDAAADGDPPRDRAEPEEDGDPDAVARPDDVEPAREDPAERDAGAREDGRDDRLPRDRRRQAHDRHEREDDERGERRERHVHAALAQHDVPWAEGRPGREPGAAMDQGVGEVVEVRAPGVEELPAGREHDARHEVDRRRGDPDQEGRRGRGSRGHGQCLRVRAPHGSDPDRPGARWMWVTGRA